MDELDVLHMPEEEAELLMETLGILPEQLALSIQNSCDDQSNDLGFADGFEP